jgi:hypothetical protein
MAFLTCLERRKKPKTGKYCCSQTSTAYAKDTSKKYASGISTIQHTGPANNGPRNNQVFKS